MSAMGGKQTLNRLYDYRAPLTGPLAEDAPLSRAGMLVRGRPNGQANRCLDNTKCEINIKPTTPESILKTQSCFTSARYIW